MGILGFLFGIGCLVVVVWAMPSAVREATIALLGHAVFGRKRWQQNRSQQPPSLTPPEVRRERNSSQSTTVLTPVLPRKVVARRQPPVSTRVRLESSRHQQYIRQANLVLTQLLKR